MIFSPAGLLERKKLMSKANEHRLGFEMDVPEFIHALLDVIFQSQDVSGGRLTPIHDG